MEHMASGLSTGFMRVSKQLAFAAGTVTAPVALRSIQITPPAASFLR